MGDIILLEETDTFKLTAEIFKNFVVFTVRYYNEGEGTSSSHYRINMAHLKKVLKHTETKRT